ncbi:amino acid adenylation domain-containing protein [Gordonia sp. HY002]|uniref:amino acid adenylation domain-containing protein n=1 Tax=Gordonia zhenghanii TaxID=2911516 RepID=UPI001EEFC5D2|nr:amino acid adenylation domain-containing protein [Gordonia zhenghanii]MCF8568831.1 amino acid adenylation domain-containing protein [Gordonia zhenghanii]MCF8602299.1 amino acid adenylation domain-containing protein [Gordonia zhenghanii]
MISLEQIRTDVASLLDVDPETIGDTDDLVRHGMHSLLVIKLTSVWRRAGHRVRSSQLAQEPTIEAWAVLLGVEPATPEPEPAPAAPDDDPEFDLATMQHAYWVGRQDGQSLGGVAAHLFAEFDGAGVDAARLERAVGRVVERHEMLRAAFGDTGKQRILDTPPTPVFSVVDLRDGSDVDAQTERTRDRMSHQLLDTAAGSVVEFVLTLLPDGRHRLHLDVDMLAADAMSYRRVLDDLATAYETDAALPSTGYTFREYLAQRGDHISADEYEGARTWWQAKEPTLPDTPTLPTIPEDRRAEPDRSVRYHHRLNAQEKDRLYAVAYDNGITPAVTFAAVFSEVIARWSTHQRFLLNVPLFNREPTHPAIDQVVGDFTNSVLIDADATHTESMIERGRRLQRELHDCAGHAAYEGLDVLRDLGRLRGAPVTPSLVFTSGLGFGELFSDRVRTLFGEPVWILSQGPQVDLDAQVVELDGGLLVNWDVRRDALPEGVMDAMFAEFQTILTGLVADGADWNDTLAIELPAAQREVRAAVTSTAPVSEPRTLHAAFFDVAAREPDRVALVTADGAELSYGDVATQARTVASALIADGVAPGDTVAVILPKGHRQPIAVLGVLAAGAVYLPIGADQPAVRREAILERGGVTAVIDDAWSSDRDGSTPLADLVPRTPSDLAYVLYTSGSTGEPKGVEVSHRAAANTLDAIADEFGLGADDRTIGLSALEFDLSVFDMFSPLSLGGALVCIDAEQTRDAQAWAAQIATHRVTVLNAAPGLIGMLLDTASDEQLASLRTVITGGDRVDAELGRRARAAVSGLRFAGLGGTTETAIHSTVYEVTDAFPADWDTVPYGRPMAGSACRVVNERGEDAPDWVTGELWIGGAGVADGYRGDPERTADRFVTVDDVRWYRTGDLARYLPDGTIEFLGRADHQVKIRGYRVELGEVEAAARSVDGVTEAVAALFDGRLALAATGVDGTALDTDQLVGALGGLLPDYMVPETVVAVDEVPLTANGKVDRASIRAALERAVAGATPQEYVAPANAVEAAVAYIAEQVLGTERLGVTTDFFDAGANSILATTFVANIRSLLAVEGVGITAVFKARTVRGFAALLADREQVPGQTTQVAEIFLEVAGVECPSGELVGASS